MTTWLVPVIVALIGQAGLIVGLFVRVGRVHQEVRSPNGHTTGDTIQRLSEGQDELLRDVAAVAVAVGEHLADHDRRR